MSLPPPLEPVDAPPALAPTIDSSASTPPSRFPPDTSGAGSTPPATGATFPSPTTTTNGSTLAPPPRQSGLPPGALAALIVGVVIGAGTVLVAVGIFVIFYRRRKRKLAAQDLPTHGPKHDPSSDPPQNWQHMAPPPTDYDGPLLSKPTPPPGILSTPPTDNYAPDKNFPNPSPGITSGFSQTSFSYEDLKLATDNFSEANLLGQGGFGYVHKGVLPNGKEVAIKQLKAGSGQGEREFQAEVDIIGRVHHRHLVTLVGYCISGAQRMLVYEFVSNKTMEFHLHGKERPVMDWPTRMKIALGSARGLAYLHEDCHPKIIHRDIKAANILLDDDFEAKVADFGLAKYSLDTDTHVSTRVMGTFGYLAPEYASSGKLTEKSDIFSFGVLLLELITGLRPIDRASSYVDDSMVDWVKPLLTQALEDGNFDAFVDRKLQEYDSSEMTRMVACAAACVRHSARRRPRMSQVVRALEGDMPLDDLTEGIKPGHSRGYSSHSYDESSEYNTMQYKEDMKKFRKLALESECSGPTSDFGPNPSSSSTEGLQTTQEMEVQRKSERDDSIVIVHVLDDEDEQPPPTSSSTEGQQTSQETELKKAEKQSS